MPHQLTKEGSKRLDELKGEALEYLVQVFTEDERKGPKDAFDFLTSIGGAIYSRKVIAKLADTFYTRRATTGPSSRSGSSSISIPTTRAVPIGRSGSSMRCARWTRTSRPSRSCASWPRATAPSRRLGQAQQDPRYRARAQAGRRRAKRGGQGAARRRATRRGGAEAHIDVDRYARAAEAYAYYLAHFATTRRPPRSTISSATSITSS